MKKYLLVIIVVLFTLSFTSCSKVETPTSEDDVELRFDITVTRTDDFGTKAIKKNWENGDKIFLFFKKNNSSNLQSNKYAILSYDGSNWTVGKDEGSSIAFNTSTLGDYGTMYAVYFPFDCVKYVKDPIYNIESYRLFYGSGNTNTALNSTLVYSYYLIDSGSDYQVSGSTLSGTLSLKLPDNFVYFYIDKVGDDYNSNEKYRLSVEGVRPATITEWSYGTFKQTKKSAGQPMWGYKYGDDGIAFAGILDDSRVGVENDYKMIFFSDGNPAVTKTFNGKTLSSHSSVKLQSPVVGNGWSQFMPTPDVEEIGGIKWAKWNLGSTSSTDRDNNKFFRWGDIMPGGDEIDKGSDMSQNHSLTGDFSIFDAARAILGKDWRMPTRSEYTTLVSSCDITTTSYFFTLKNKTGEESISFLNKSGASGMGGTIYYWTSEKKDNTYVYVRYNDSGSASFPESSSGESAKRLKGNYLIRPIYIGE